MSWLHGARARFHTLFRRRAADERLSEEMAFHLEMEAQRLRRAGVPEEEARRRARLAFGGVDRYAEAVRDGRRIPVVEDVARDVAHVVRSLRRTPAFTVSAVLLLALGVAANTTVFSLVSATLLRPLPFPAPQELVVLHQLRTDAGESTRPVRWSYPEFEALRASLRSIHGLSALYADDVNFYAGHEPVRVRIETVSAGYFATLGAPISMGRNFLAEEDVGAGTHPVVIVGDRLWRTRLGGDPAIVGRFVALNGVPVRVVGIASRNFAGLSGEAEAWIPQALAPAVVFSGQLTTPQQFLTVVGRLADGVTVAQARAELGGSVIAAVTAARVEAGGASDAQWPIELVSLESARRDPSTVRAQLVISGAVFLVLLVAMTNLSALQLARAFARRRETAIRAALGAGRGRLVRRALVESAVLGVAAGLVGLLVALWSGGVVRVLVPERLGRGAGHGGWNIAALAEPATDWRVALFAALLAVGAGLFAGLLPALRGTGPDVADPLRGSRGGSVRVGTLRRPTALSIVVVAQLALALVLLAGAGVLLDGYRQLRTIDLGYRASNVLTMRISPPESRYGGAAAAPLLERILQQVQTVPGVVSASVSRCAPTMRCSSTPLYRPGIDDPAPIVGRLYVGPDHFRTLGIPLLRGRALSDDDRVGRPRVAVVNETAARLFWPGEDPLGQHVWFGSGGGFASPDSLTEIVGVVGDVLYAAPGEAVGPDVYTSYHQFTWPETMLIVRTAVAPEALVPALRQAVAAVDPHLPIFDVQTLDERTAGALAAERFATLALSLFALLALLLAAIGVYGVMAYSVSQRRREIGIRLAMGATPSAVLRLVVANGAALSAAGAAIGLILAAAAGGALPALVPTLDESNARVFAVAAPALLLVAVATCWLAARGVSRVDPVETLGEQ